MQSRNATPEEKLKGKQGGIERVPEDERAERLHWKTGSTVLPS